MTTLAHYQNTDGAFTSPKNGKTYKSEKALRAHLSNRGSGGWSKVNSRKNLCQYCNTAVSIPNVSNHENGCYLNPNNKKSCFVCDTPIKNYKTSKGTCSRACANKHFRAGYNNGNWKTDRYQTTCWAHHKKACVYCGEDKIVTVHHYDQNHNNNEPGNLVPLCPTHHQYVHSRYRHIVQPSIDLYVEQFKSSV